MMIASKAAAEFVQDKSVSSGGTTERTSFLPASKRNGKGYYIVHGMQIPQVGYKMLFR